VVGVAVVGGGVVLVGVGAVADVDAVVLLELELRFAVAPLRRGVVGVEHPSADSATPTITVSTQTANHFFMCDRSELGPSQQRVPAAVTET
jgi:hypothetical protein